MSKGLFLNWKLRENDFLKKKKKKKIILNFGPQHPAAHGVLRLLLQLVGEAIERCDPHIGLLHRGTEKLMESKHFEKSIPYFDRLDYVSMMTQEHAYCLAIEHLHNKKNMDLTTNFQRILFDEITRILNHFLAIACHALDVGSMSSIFWAFEEREKLMEFYERVSGARMHAAFHRPFSGFSNKIDSSFLHDLALFTKNCFTTLNEMHNVLTYNKIWKQRLVNIGSFSAKDVVNYGLTGVLARSVGVKRDVRLSVREGYSGYENVQFKSYISFNGDCYDRFLLRMFEMSESLLIINKCLNYFSKIFKKTKLRSEPQVTLLLNKNKQKRPANSQYQYMEDLIEHFISWHGGVKTPQGVTNVFIESPKGEFGVTLFSNNSGAPHRCKIRSPSYVNLQFLPKLIKGHYVADLAALIGTIDIVFGEVDR